MNPIETSFLAGDWRARRARRRDDHTVVLGLGRDGIWCGDGDGLEASRLHVEVGDTVTWRSDTHRWSVDFGKLSPFQLARIEGAPGESVTLRVREDAFTGVEYRYFAALAVGSEQGTNLIRGQPRIMVEPYAIPGPY